MLLEDLRPERDGLEDVLAGADAAVHVDFDLVAHRIDDRPHRAGVLRLLAITWRMRTSGGEIVSGLRAAKRELARALP